MEQEKDYLAWCPEEGDRPEDGRGYTFDEAESAEVAAARYALFFAKRFCSDEPAVLRVHVRDASAEVTVVEVGVDLGRGLWQWRVTSLAVATAPPSARPSPSAADSEPPEPTWHWSASPTNPWEPACGTHGPHHFVTRSPGEVTCKKPRCRFEGLPRRSDKAS